MERSPARKGIDTRKVRQNNHQAYNHQMAVCFISVSLSELLKLIQKCLDKICSVESTVQAYSLNIALVNEDFQTQILGAECINHNV